MSLFALFDTKDNAACMFLQSTVWSLLVRILADGCGLAGRVVWLETHVLSCHLLGFVDPRTHEVWGLDTRLKTTVMKLSRVGAVPAEGGHLDGCCLVEAALRPAR